MKALGVGFVCAKGILQSPVIVCGLLPSLVASKTGRQNGLVRCAQSVKTVLPFELVLLFPVSKAKVRSAFVRAASASERE